MKKKLITGVLTLSLFIGGTATTSVLAGADDIETQTAVQTELASNNEVSPEATPAAAGAYAMQASRVAATAFVGGFTAKAGADAYDALGGSAMNASPTGYENIKVVFDQ
ncbi:MULTISPECIES: hypothetical protein [Virgibacillus]|uniref:Uncharacterized protein n=1 Tax=Virgibacillus salarius TaxID=447199 RepID=A0A941DYM9_9BACI|nr:MULTISPECIES: hypothetical protein [Virgibacillus]MBR7797504.1 hypothetical protein [Virgibacillus salarius]MDY7046034.1 hypothetical protein [Virgibacillus sp. M23]NAZ10215.1 hypothetical protein [Agaribacter marinus]WBX79912.1 hypothetical protein PD280_20165 [Virgibacillus salarius]